MPSEYSIWSRVTGVGLDSLAGRALHAVHARRVFIVLVVSLAGMGAAPAVLLLRIQLHQLTLLSQLGNLDLTSKQKKVKKKCFF